jgi:hypothetical protein
MQGVSKTAAVTQGTCGCARFPVCARSRNSAFRRNPQVPCTTRLPTKGRVRRHASSHTTPSAATRTAGGNAVRVLRQLAGGRSRAFFGQHDPRRDRGQPRHLRPAHVHPVGLRGDRRGRVRRHVLFDLRAPQVEGGRGREFPREHHARDRVDRRALPDPRHLRRPRDADAAEHLQRRRSRSRRDDHGLPVEVEIRIPRQGCELLLRAEHLAERVQQHPQSRPGAQGRALPARSR